MSATGVVLMQFARPYDDPLPREYFSEVISRSPAMGTRPTAVCLWKR